MQQELPILSEIPSIPVPPSAKRKAHKPKVIKEYIPALFAIAIWRTPTQRVNVAPSPAPRLPRGHQSTLKF